MKRHAARWIVLALLRMLSLLAAVSGLSFLLVSLSPVDPVQAYVGAGAAVSPEQREEIARYWGLEEAPVQRFLAWGKAVLRGDMGTSLIYRKPVLSVIRDLAGASLALMGTAWLLSGVFGFGAGLLMAVKRGRWVDRCLTRVCLLLSSTPTFWLGLLFLMIFSVWLGWFPIGFSVPAGKLAAEVTVWERLYHLLLPALTLSLVSIGHIAMQTRTKMAEVLESDYSLFAKARGETRGQVLRRHGLRNCLMPALTLQFASFSELFGGSILAEQVFSYPGLGQAAVQAGLRGDVPLLLGIAVSSALFVFIGNTTANLLYGVVNPQLRGARR